MWKYFTRQIYSCSFHIVTHDLYSQCLTEILSKMRCFIYEYATGSMYVSAGGLHNL
jgi:hypothetical protein